MKVGVKAGGHRNPHPPGHHDRRPSQRPFGRHIHHIRSHHRPQLPKSTPRRHPKSQSRIPRNRQRPHPHLATPHSPPPQTTTRPHHRHPVPPRLKTRPQTVHRQRNTVEVGRKRVSHKSDLHTKMLKNCLPAGSNPMLSRHPPTLPWLPCAGFVAPPPRGATARRARNTRQRIDIIAGCLAQHG